MIFAQTSIDRGDISEQIFDQISSFISSLPYFILVCFESDATVKEKDGRKALRRIVHLSKRDDLKILQDEANIHVGVSLIYSDNFQLESKPEWNELSGPRTPRGRAGGYKHHLLKANFTIRNNINRERFCIIAAHQISMVDIHVLDPFNCGERRRQAKFILQLARSLVQDSNVVIVMRDANDHLYGDRKCELDNRQKYGFFSPTDAIDDLTFKLAEVKTSPGGLHRSLYFVRPFIRTPIMKLLKINTKVDSICVPIEIKDKYIFRPAYLPLNGLDHGLLQIELTQHSEQY